MAAYWLSGARIDVSAAGVRCISECCVDPMYGVDFVEVIVENIQLVGVVEGGIIEEVMLFRWARLGP